MPTTDEPDNMPEETPRQSGDEIQILHDAHDDSRRQQDQEDRPDTPHGSRGGDLWLWREVIAGCHSQLVHHHTTSLSLPPWPWHAKDGKCCMSPAENTMPPGRSLEVFVQDALVNRRNSRILAWSADGKDDFMTFKTIIL